MKKMKNKKRKLAAILALCVAFTGALSGCGTKSSEEGGLQTAGVSTRALTEAELGLICVNDIVAESWAREEAERAAVSLMEKMRDSSFSMLSLAVSDYKVQVKATSVEKDLRIQFVDDEGKLVKNRAFEITVTDSKKNEKQYIDEDKDGKITINNLEAGNYTVLMMEMDGLTVSKEPLTVKVKDKVDYKKIDGIENEVKKESEINAKVEDTTKNNVDTGAVLPDTVEWVESTKTKVDSNGNPEYQEVPAGEIAVPVLTSKANKSVRESILRAAVLDGVSLSHSQITMDTGASEKIWVEGLPEGASVQYLSEDKNVADVAEDGTVTGKSGGNTTIKATVKIDSESLELTCAVTINTNVIAVAGVSLDQTNIVLETGKSAALNAAVKPDNAQNKKVKWSSSDESIAKVEGGKVTALKAGTAVITVTTEEGGFTAECNVTVNKAAEQSVPVAEITVSGNAAVTVGGTSSLSAAVKPDNATNKEVIWSSSDEKIAAVDGKGVVTGIKAGTVTITAKAADNSGIKGTYKVTVGAAAGNVTNPTEPLKDKSGNQLYVKSGDTYVKVTNAEYKSGTKYYRVIEGSNTTWKYTGWQTIDGKLYYFDKNGVKVTGEQVIKGVKYTFASDGSLVQGTGINGIDVSKWNGTIDWAAVKNSGISWVMIRVGYRGSSTGVLVEDPTFKRNISGAIAAGLKVGVYFFTQAINEVEAVEEASMTINLIKPYNITYPVVIDTEAAGGRADRISVAQRTAVCRAFAETVKASGYTPGVYASKSWFLSNVTVSQLNSYKIWLAHYTSQTNYTGKYDMWQYTDKGRVPGISTDVDLNFSYLGY